MTTAAEILDRTLNTILHPGGDGAPEWDTLASTMLVGATSFTTNGLMSYTPKGVVEIDYELILTKEAETTTAVDVNERGYRETTAKEHAAGTKVYVDVTFPRHTLYNALNATIGDLYSMGLYKRTLDTDETASFTPFALDTGTLRVISCRYKDGLTWRRARQGWHFEVMHETSPPEIQWLSGPTSGAMLRLVTAGDFTQLGSDPTNVTTGEAADLTTYCGIPNSLVPHLPLAIAAHVLQGQELTRVQLEEIRSRMAAEQVPVGASVNLAGAFMALFERKVSAEVGKLRDMDGIQSVWRR